MFNEGEFLIGCIEIGPSSNGGGEWMMTEKGEEEALKFHFYPQHDYR